MSRNLTKSSTERFLIGKQTTALPAPIHSVWKQGDKRILVDERSNRTVLTKEQLLTVFNGALADTQHSAMLRTIRTMRNHRASVMLGGKTKGERRVYDSRSRAEQVLARRYNQRTGN